MVCPPATADMSLWGKNASVLHLCVDISALTFGTNANFRPLLSISLRFEHAYSMDFHGNCALRNMAIELCDIHTNCHL